MSYDPHKVYVIRCKECTLVSKIWNSSESLFFTDRKTWTLVKPLEFHQVMTPEGGMRVQLAPFLPSSGDEVQMVASSVIAVAEASADLAGTYTQITSGLVLPRMAADSPRKLLRLVDKDGLQGM